MLDLAQLEAAGLLDGVENERARRERVELVQQLLLDGFSRRSMGSSAILRDGREVDRIVGAVPKQEIVRRLDAAWGSSS